MRLRGMAFLIGCVLSSCGGPSVEGEQTAAEYACLVRALAIRGTLLEALAEERDEGSEATGSKGEEWPEPSFRFVSTGQFVIDYGRIPAMHGGEAFDLRCTGDFNARRFTTVQINGSLHRPAERELWPTDWYGEGAEAQ